MAFSILASSFSLTINDDGSGDFVLGLQHPFISWYGKLDSNFPREVLIFVSDSLGFLLASTEQL